MSEATLSNLIITAITALVTIALAAIAAWKTAKLGAHSGAVEAMIPVANQLQANSDTLQQQGDQLTNSAKKLDQIHSETNSQLESYKKLIRDEAASALMSVIKENANLVAEAVKEGIAKGIELERQRVEAKNEQGK